MQSAYVFNIQRFSVHDGDGIRTTVFFKGCPLRCLWCHNPEGLSASPSLLYSAEKCVGCGACEAICPVGAVKIEDGVAKEDFSLCTSCGKCVPPCLGSARSIAGVRMTTDEIVRKCAADRMFYEESGGGVTLSGGEILMQSAEFLAELTYKLHDAGLSVNIDTSGFASWEKFEAVLPYTDTFLYDIKSADSTKHKAFTGVSPELIFENLRHLSSIGAKIYIRIPVIAPSGDTGDDFEGANFTDDDLSCIIALLSDIRFQKIFLLPYHNTGVYKTKSLGMTGNSSGNLPGSFPGNFLFVPPTAERITEMKDALSLAFGRDRVVY
ncbi:MAG: glycyl-radical enzyme activating protein [Clostridia bacterium]|nr:glycyl-radical enzyme activating protein [Clostridia bacterium]